MKVSHYITYSINSIFHSNAACSASDRMQQSELNTADESNGQRWRMKKCSHQRGYIDKDDAAVRTWHDCDNVNPEAVGAQCGRVARRFSAGALRGCGFKAGCHEAGSTENGPRTSIPAKKTAPVELIGLSKITGDKYVQFKQKSLHFHIESGPPATVISIGIIAAPQKGVSFIMATSHGAPHLCTASWRDILDTRP